MQVWEMREAIAKVYPGYSWKQKVEKMPDDQVIAVYYKFLGEGRFDKKVEKKETKPAAEPKCTSQKKEDYAVQLSIYDFIASGGA